MYSNNKKFNVLGKNSGVTVLYLILVLALGVLGFEGKGAALLIG
jgi:hypothetical protein